MTESISLDSLFLDSKEVKQVVQNLEKAKGSVFLYGSDDYIFSVVATAISEMSGRDILLYFEDDIKARSAYQGEQTIYLPPKEHTMSRSIAHSKAAENSRNEAILQLASLDEGNGSGRKPVVVYTSVVSALERYPNFHQKKNYVDIRTGDRLALADFYNFLYNSGYEKVHYIEQKAEVSTRGGIIDVYSPMNEHPVRIELFGDEVASMRWFDLATASSIQKITECRIYAGAGEQSRQDDTYLEDYLDNPIVFVLSASASLKRLRQNEEDYHTRLSEMLLDEAQERREGEQGKRKDEQTLSWKAEGDRAVIPNRRTEPVNSEQNPRIESSGRYLVDEVVDRWMNSPLVLTELLHKELPSDVSYSVELAFHAKEVYGEVSAVISEIAAMLEDKYRVLLSFSSDERRTRFEALLHEKQFAFPYHKGNGILASGDLRLVLSDFDKGMVFPSFRTAVLTEKELFATKKKRKQRKKGPMSVKVFTELVKGDYVVHDANGIGVFAGIVERVRDGVTKEYVKINYAGSDVLYIPVESANSVRKYIGGSDNVKLSSLSSKSWKNQVSKAKKHIEDIADDLVELYAKRRQKIGFAYPEDTRWQAEFEDLFPYEETEDQLRATEEIKRDMERPIPMDRLLSGDVGYGKTEVALRAAFKAVSASKQVAVLVPTTVLAQQHHGTITKRFANYPVKVAMISRFRSAEEIREILKQVKKGEVDILVGTHRILSKDVVFKDLGLLIVDEEQRLGVKHKEAVKLMKENVDVLTLTATPIPRTLHMSMIGVRDMSVLDDPPEERMPVQTYVAEYSDAVAREAMLRELERGGQIYYVYNRIEGIERIKNEIEDMLPSASVRVAHGRMGEENLERVMLDFMAGKFDILVTTTIIETGLDIPNVNTMIVRRADMFGLSQLYQLRGRVGRSAKRGYCYAFFQKGKILNEVQERRLRAIREFTDFGSGFKIAMKDLEIRGAGSLLGTEQSGFMDTVGYDMFLRLLETAIRKRHGEEAVELEEARVELQASAYIPKDYVDDVQTRIRLYREISAMEDEAESILAEIEDQFGTAPRALKNLLNIAEIKSMSEHIQVTRIGEESGELYFRFKQGATFDLQRMGSMLNNVSEIVYRSGASEELRMKKPTTQEWTDIVAKTMRKVYSYLGKG